jgi:molybdate transport system ATP-binding protein
MLAGFMKPESGCINMNGEVWFDSVKQINTAPQFRKTGFVFQDYALFPNMNVRENIAFGSKKNDNKNIVDELLELTRLSMLASRKIQTLSGGQKQRVALARAIASKPSLLLLDEPLSAIDNKMRQQLQNTLLKVHKRYKLTTFLVSHDMDEIIKLGDEMIHLEEGVIKNRTAPSDFFLNTCNFPVLTGDIVSIEEKNDTAFAIVLLKNRVIKINTDKDCANFSVGEKVEIIYENAKPIIRKL